MKCGNCNIDFPNRKAMIAHMVIVHNSPFDTQSHPEYKTDQEAVQAALSPVALKGLSDVLSGK